MNNLVEQPVAEKMKPETRLSFLQNFIVRFVQIIVVFPLSVLINYNLPNTPYIDYDLHFLLAVVLATTLSVVITLISRRLIMGLFLAIVLVMLFNKTFDDYDLNDLYADYNAMFANLTSSPHKVSYFQPVKGTYFQEWRVKNALQHTHPEVRQYAAVAATRHFDEKFYRKHGKIVRYFSIFKSIRDEWKYVHDPRGLDYYSTATESMKIMAGDCDDYSILMASSIMAIGGEARIIITSNHMYTEVKMGKEEDIDKIDYVVRLLFPEESKRKEIHYHLTDGYVWINFDYTGRYPGGPFMSSDVNKVINFNY